jgi:hypothetical protein
MTAPYEAVIGYDDDPEYAVWGEGAHAALTVEAAALGYLVEVGIADATGTHEATIYAEPRWAERDDGALSVTRWLDRGRCEVVIDDMGGITVGPIRWDGTRCDPRRVTP